MSFLFGIRLNSLFYAIAVVESERGATSSNVYQIRDIYLKDVNRIMQRPNCRYFPPFRLCDKLNRSRSEDAMSVYWLHWGKVYERDTGNRVTPEILARIHNGGPFGYRRPSTFSYWQKVLTVLLSITPDEADRWMNNHSPGVYKHLITDNHTRLLGVAKKEKTDEH